MRLALLHTTPLAYDLFRRELGDADCCHLIDEYLFDMIRADGSSPAIPERIGGLMAAAAAGGAGTFLCTCSSTSPYFDRTSPPEGLAVLKIDDPACRAVASRGGRVGVVCSVETTVDSTMRRVHRFAEDLGTHVELSGILARGAFEALSAGDGNVTTPWCWRRLPAPAGPWTGCSSPRQVSPASPTRHVRRPGWRWSRPRAPA
ncbi:MAG: hypothetical protein J0H63_10005 [Rhizobiales bacterium]|nr:hypothetical protein [Hyphomicrobiales bacterium]MBN9010439.1 hypothetical protein [Hyphomicrobiales bacterium]